MPLKQVGGRGLSKQQREESKRRTERRNKRKRTRKRSSDKRKQALREQGFQLKNRIFLDRGNYGILKQLKLNTYYNVSKYFISAHGSIDRVGHFTVPDNIVIMYLGMMGNLTLSIGKEGINDICNGKVIPNSIILPGEKAPNVTLNGEYNIQGISGIFECGSIPKRVLNKVLVPQQDVIDSYKDGEPNEFDIMKDPETGEYPVYSKHRYKSTLDKAVHKISKLLNKNTYAFVYLDACLGGFCGMPMTQKDFNSVVNPEKFNILRTGDTLYNPKPTRLETVRGSVTYDVEETGTETKLFLHKMSLAKDEDHWNYRYLLFAKIEKYDFGTFVYRIYENIEKYYEYDVNDMPDFLRYANMATVKSRPPRDYDHFVYFIDAHQKILKAFLEKDKDKVFALTRRENALRYSINPAKYKFLAEKYGMTDIYLEHIYPFPENIEKVNENTKNLNKFSEKLSKKKTLPSLFLKEVWEQYVKNPLIRSSDESIFSDFWFDDHEKMKNLKNQKRLTKKQDIELQDLQKAYDYYTITSFMAEIIQTIDFYEEKSEGRLEVFKNTDLPSYNMVLVKKLMTMAIEYVSSDDYKRREIAYKDKIIKQLEDMNSMIENHGSQAGGGGDFLASLFKFFGF